MKFKYKKFANGILRPIIPIDFFHADNSEEKTTFEVLVDSGADQSILPADIAEIIGINVESGQPGRFMGITGTEKELFMHEITMAVGGRQIQTRVSFTYALPPQAMGVVGQHGFFDFFVVKFDLRKALIELRPKQ